MSKFIQATNIDASDVLLEAGKIPLLFSNDDIKYNLNKFLEHKVPVLWITGISGGGKTTLANKIADETSADLLSLDTIKHFINLMIFCDDEVNEIVSKDNNFYLIQKLLKKDPDKYLEKQLHGKAYLELLCYLIKEILKKHSNSNQIIIEGVQIADMFWFDKSFYNENSAIIIKGTSLATSFFRRFRRDQGRGGFINKFSDIGKILRLYKEWYGYQNEFRETITPNKESFIPNYNEFYVFSQAGEYDCGAAVALSIINYLNGNVKLSLNDVTKELKTDENGTSTTNMVSFFKSKGFKVDSCLDKGCPNSYQEFTDLLNSYLSKGIPIIVENKYLDSHWRIIIGYDEDNETLIITDSYSKINGINVTNARDFFANWYDLYMEKGIQFKQWIAVYK